METQRLQVFVHYFEMIAVVAESAAKMKSVCHFTTVIVQLQLPAALLATSGLPSSFCSY